MHHSVGGVDDPLVLDRERYSCSTPRAPRLHLGLAMLFVGASLDYRGMAYYIKRVDESALDHNSMVEYSFDKRQRIYWKDGSFPDAAMTKKDVQTLKEATTAIEKVKIKDFY